MLGICSSCPTFRTRIIELHSRMLELPLLVRSVTFSFLFIYFSGELKASFFLAVIPPLSPKEGNSGCFSIRFNYCSYGKLSFEFGGTSGMIVSRSTVD